MTGNEHYEDGAREADESIPLGRVGSVSGREGLVGKCGYKLVLSSGPRVQLEVRRIASVTQKVAKNAWEVWFDMVGEYCALIRNRSDGTNVAEGLKRGDHVLVDDMGGRINFFYGPVDLTKFYIPE